MDESQTEYVCPNCTRLQLAPVPVESKEVQVEDLSKHPDGTVSYYVLLECEKVECKAPVVVLSPTERGTDGAQLTRTILQEWTYVDGRCAKGHKAMRPFLIGRYEILPLD